MWGLRDLELWTDPWSGLFQQSKSSQNHYRTSLALSFHLSVLGVKPVLHVTQQYLKDCWQQRVLAPIDYPWSSVKSGVLSENDFGYYPTWLPRTRLKQPPLPLAAIFHIPCMATKIAEFLATNADASCTLQLLGESTKKAWPISNYRILHYILLLTWK